MPHTWPRPGAPDHLRRRRVAKGSEYVVPLQQVGFQGPCLQVGPGAQDAARLSPPGRGGFVMPGASVFRGQGGERALAGSLGNSGLRGIR